MEIFLIFLFLISVVGFILFCKIFLKNRKDLVDLKERFELSREESLTFAQKNKEIAREWQDSAAKNISLVGRHQELLRNSQIQANNINELNLKINELLEKQDKQVKSARLDAVATSKAVIRGKVSENLAVLLPNWRWNVADSRFLGGSPLDFIVYRGLSDDLITEIILIDVKTGAAQLTSRQKQIKNAISAGKVSFETVYIDKKIEIINP